MTLSRPPISDPSGNTPGFEVVASLADLGEGMLLQRVRASGDSVCLVRYNGAISALSDICTHQHFSMSHGDLLDDGTVQCAWHGARFDCRTGEVKQVPATSPLPVFQVRIEGDRILVGPRCARINGKYESSIAPVGADAVDNSTAGRRARGGGSR